MLSKKSLEQEHLGKYCNALIKSTTKMLRLKLCDASRNILIAQELRLKFWVKSMMNRRNGCQTTVSNYTHGFASTVIFSWYSSLLGRRFMILSRKIIIRVFLWKIFNILQGLKSQNSHDNYHCFHSVKPLNSNIAQATSFCNWFFGINGLDTYRWILVWIPPIFLGHPLWTTVYHVELWICA